MENDFIDVAALHQGEQINLHGVIEIARTFYFICSDQDITRFLFLTKRIFSFEILQATEK